MTRPKVRLRSVLIVVAILALALGGWEMARRRAECLARAAAFSRELTFWRRLHAELHKDSERAGQKAADARAVKEDLRRAGPTWYPDWADQLKHADCLIGAGEVELAELAGSIRHCESRIRALRRRVEECRDAANRPWLVLPESLASAGEE